MSSFLKRVTELVDKQLLPYWLQPTFISPSDRLRGQMAQYLLDRELTPVNRPAFLLNKQRNKTRIAAPIRPLMKSWVRNARLTKMVAAGSAVGLASLSFGALVASKGEDTLPAGAALAFATLAGAGALRAARYQHIAEGLLHHERHMHPQNFRCLLQAAATVGHYGEQEPRRPQTTAKVIKFPDRMRPPQ